MDTGNAIINAVAFDQGVYLFIVIVIIMALREISNTGKKQ